MNPRLLEHYELELQHIKEMGAEFAAEFPEIAAGLGLDRPEIGDPYVERLIEGAAFLAARVQLKLTAEFPRFTQALLETVYPHYLTPIPSMLVAECVADPNEPNLARGHVVPRGTGIESAPNAPGGIACEFRTAQDVTLWPLEVVSATYFTHAPDLPLAGLPIGQQIAGGVRIRLKTTAGVPFSQVSADSLRFYLAGRGNVTNKLYELCTATSLGGLVRPAAVQSPWFEVLKSDAVQPVGYTDADAMLPVTLRSFQGYRLLQEYFAFPERFRFIDVTGLARAFSKIEGREAELVLLFSRGEPGLEGVVEARHFALHCTPAINLFRKRTDRINLTDATHEYHVVPDRTRPLDFEVFDVISVTGHGVGSDSERTFQPLYAAYGTDDAHHRSAYFITRREPRMLSSEQRRKGSRSSYVGGEVFLSLVDAAHAPYAHDLRQLSIEAHCTNRDAVVLMAPGRELTLDTAAPVRAVKVLAGPSRPYSPLAERAVAWRAISHLSLNYLSLAGAAPGEGAAALRELLDLYAPEGDAGARKQVESIRSVTVKPVVRRLPPTVADAWHRGTVQRLAFGRGLQIAVEVDELAFEGGSAYVLGSVLNHFFARYVSLNSFTETSLRAQARGEIHRWQPQWGMRPTV
jgi:type VI secretion system protein ImpG